MNHLTANTMAYRARKTALGLCIEGGCWNLSAFALGAPHGILCPHHLERNRLRASNRRAAQLREGLCLYPACPNLHEPGRASCTHHLALNRTRSLRYYYERTRREKEVHHEAAQ